MRVSAVVLLACCSFSGAVRAEDDVDVTDIDQLPIEALLNIPTTVASTKATRLRESPGVLTVLTQAELERMGVRDLTDVLHLVPGFEMATDVSGGVGVGFRGNWGHEGKVLLLWDGVEMNETLYYTTVFGHHFPMNDIDRIEIIRGPGSVIYGGAAELAVINVVTTNGATRRSVGAYGSVGSTTTTLSRVNGGISYGQAINGGLFDGLDLTADVYAGHGIRSDARYTAVCLEGSRCPSYDMSQASNLDPTFVNLGARLRGFEARFVFDGYRTTQQDGYSDILDRPYAMDFPAWFLNLKYNFKPLENLTITPRLELKRQNPWRNLDAEPPVQLNLVATRAKAGITTSWDPTAGLNVIGGVEGFIDHVQDGTDSVLTTLTSLSSTGETYDFKNGAAFGQVLLKTAFFNLTAGARGEYHSVYGGSFVPRVALTKVFDRVHVKFLVSGAFKAPSIYNIVISPDIKPEHARTLEAEAGLQVTDFLYVTGNLFDITINDPIIYKYDEANAVDTFKNFTKTGSRGVELEALMKLEDVQINLAYAFYSAESKNEVDIYQVPGEPGMNLAFPQHKVSGSVTYTPIDKVSVTSTFALRSNRSGEVSVDADGAPVFQSLAPTALVNGVVAMRDIGVNGLDASVGVYNLLGDTFVLPQAYYAGHAPLPAEPFEVLLKARYRFAL
jgi:outer membrane receptor for ferrienterochelin and colicin